MKVIKTAKFIAAKNVINNPENIRNVLDLYQKGYNQHRIAKTLNLAYNTVGRIFAYNHWRSPRDVLNAINLQYAQKYNRTPMASKKEYLQTLPPEKRLNFMSNFIDNIFGPQTENTEFWNKIKEIASDPDAPRGGIFSGTPEEMNIQEKCPCCGVKRNQATKRRFLNKQIKDLPRSYKWMEPWLATGRTPPGYEVHHKRAIFDKGEDTVDNMVLQLKANHDITTKLYTPKGQIPSIGNQTLLPTRDVSKDTEHISNNDWGEFMNNVGPQSGTQIQQQQALPEQQMMYARLEGGEIVERRPATRGRPPVGFVRMPNDRIPVAAYSQLPLKLSLA
tara:strand:+ start:2629 stop:3627 length:999 start_codon:yes stop_codon:yes gene_type:complete